jgi:hypothetical protein
MTISDVLRHTSELCDGILGDTAVDRAQGICKQREKPIATEQWASCPIKSG